MAKARNVKKTSIEDRENNRCFIITQIGNQGSNIRRKSDGLIQSTLRPILERFNLVAVAAHEIEATGSISQQIIKHLVEDRLVIANLTGLNPNVMYELAVRHAVRKPVVTIVEVGTELPFDVAQEYTIFYHDDMKGTVELTESLNSTIQKALSEDKPDNPLYRGIATSLIKTEHGSFESIVLSRFESIERSISSIWGVKEARSGTMGQELSVSFVFESNAHRKHFEELIDNLAYSTFEASPGDADKVDYLFYNVKVSTGPFLNHLKSLHDAATLL